ncbi:SDR family oxidoreductase [Variovorax sp. J31P179]|uniref:SDR family oxidoreductase n=1 Tax=Variovorax sp. J31P179 TaxID=3053508 RepID=UPI0025791096|nr:SDR family oxidoreductase [Variovorax sp. J31P179]MDM0084875.1 SDR family oxidoreductase [Variovorax sp. J31P179]
MKNVSVMVIVGLGDMGLDCARRIGAGQRLLLADCDAGVLASAAATLRDAGYDVLTQAVDVADAQSVSALAAAAQAAGRLRAMIHTAGLSPTMASPERIYAVDPLGAALVMDAFLPLAQEGSVAAIIASAAPQIMPTPVELEQQLATAPSGALLAVVGTLHKDDAYGAYAVSKRGNQLRVEAVAGAWGERGARIVSIGPGLIHAGMGMQEEKANPQLAALRSAVPMKRVGTPEDIAAAVEWLIGPNASFMSGGDLRIDGGVVSRVKWASP